MPIPIGVLAQAGAGGAGGLSDDYELISTFEASTNTTTVSFTSIPQTYKHLQIRHSIRGGQSAQAAVFRMRFNGVSSGTPYNSHRLLGNGTSVTWDTNTSANEMIVGYLMGSGTGTTNAHGGGIIDILDYTLTSKHKTVRCFGGARGGSTGEVALMGAQWRSTSAITSIEFSTTVAGEFLIASFNGTSRFSLYGVK